MLALMVAVPSVRADTCCKVLRPVTHPCNSYEGGKLTCSGSITVMECDTSEWGNGSNFQTKQYGCCSQSWPSLYSPSGVCVYSGQILTADLAPTLERTRDVWVRNCDGRYHLLSLPVAG